MFNKLRYYRKHPRVILGKIKRKIFIMPDITVIIPTYKENAYIEEAVNSVLNQKYPKNKIKIIIIVNGKDEAYYNKLNEIYKNNKDIEVLYTKVVGVDYARNYAANLVTTKYLAFLDDDDFLTPNFLYNLLFRTQKETAIICGKLFDYKEDTPINENTYINTTIDNIDQIYTNDYFKAASLFSTICAKIYNTKYYKSLNRDTNNLKHTEDIYFWVRNADKLNVKIRLSSKTSKEAYIRRLVDDSRSRPTNNDRNFYINDRLLLIKLFEEELLKEKNDLTAKRFILNKIISQTNVMTQYYNKVEAEDRKEILELIKKSKLLFLNKSKFGLEKGIAFCHNFPPYIDASSYVASKRLSKVSELCNEIINWDVISADMSNCRGVDSFYDMFYAKFQYTNLTRMPGKAYFSEKAQNIWGEKAYELVKDKEYKYIYSRSMWAGSHIAAYLYKKNHPDTIWYAEFSDPIYMDTDNSVRKTAQTYEGEESFLNNFWYDVEQYVFDNADKIIFTNDNQKEYMLSYRKTEVSQIDARSIVLNHPVINSNYTNIIESNYPIQDDKINIGFFGNFYKNRNGDDLIKFLENPNVVIHLFTSSTADIPDSDRIMVNKPVSNLEFLNIASKMDYLFLNDITFAGEINPYLPSKLADYLSTSTPIIAIINKGTELEKYASKKIIKLYSLDKKFIKKLVKSDTLCDTEVINIPYYKELYTNVSLDYVAISEEILKGMANLGFNNLKYPSMYNDNNIIWEFQEKLDNGNTFYLYYYGLRMIYILVRAYTINKNKKYIEKAKEILNSFYDNFFHNKIENDMLFNDHAQAERIENIVYFYSILKQNNSISSEESKKCFYLIDDALNKLLSEKYYQKHHNHGIIADKACLIGLSFTMRYNMIDYVKERLQEQITYAFSSDGVHIENSVDYHYTVVQGIMYCINILNYINNPFNEQINKLINNICEFMVYSYKPNGRRVLFGDSKGAYNKKINSEDYGSEELKYVLSKGTSGKEPQDKFKYFESGYIFLREHFNKEYFEDATYLSIKAGYKTRIHKHQDDLSICLYSKKHDIFIDPGMYNYIPKDPIKDYMESMPAHTTIGIKDQPYSIANGNGDKFKILSRKKTKDYDYVLCVSNVYYDTSIYRNIYYCRDIDVLLVEDNIYSKNSHTYAQYYHLSSDVKISNSNKDLTEISLKNSDYKVYVNQINDVDSLNVLEGLKTTPYSLESAGFGKYKVTETLEYNRTAANTSFVTLIDIAKSDNKAIIEKKDKTILITKDGKTIEIKLDEQKYVDDNTKNVEISFKNGLLTIVNNELNDCEQCAYLFHDDKPNAIKMAYTKDSKIEINCKGFDKIHVMYYLKNKWGTERHGILCTINKKNKRSNIKKFDMLHFPKVYSHKLKKEDNMYTFIVDTDFELPASYKWFVYKDGAQIYCNENEENEFQYIFDTRGEYAVMVSVSSLYFKEFDFYQYDIIKID